MAEGPQSVSRVSQTASNSSEHKKIEIDVAELQKMFDSANTVTSPEQWEKDVGHCNGLWFQWRRTKCWLNAPSDVQAQLAEDAKGQTRQQFLTREEFKPLHDQIKEKYNIDLDFNRVANVIKPQTPDEQYTYYNELVTMNKLKWGLRAYSNDVVVKEKK